MKNALSCLLPALAATLAATGAMAQMSLAKFKAGDRVEVDSIQASSPARAIWKKGVVTQVDAGAVAYFVQLDPVPGQLPKMVTIPIRPYAANWIHATAGAAPAMHADALHLDANGSVLADRALLDCTRSGPAARNGSSPPVAHIRELIRCLYEHPSMAGADGATTMDIQEFAPGSPHRWNKKVDSGAGGTPETMVYPFRVRWNQKTFYRSYSQVQTGSERVFNCYVNVDRWLCGSAQFVKDGVKTQVPVH